MTEDASLNFLNAPLQESAQTLLEHFGELSPHKKAIFYEALRLVSEEHNVADMKMMSKVLRETRRGLKVFRPYQTARKVSIFGSARTPASNPRYAQVRDCAAALRDKGFMIITGGGGGMMQAANEGAGFEHSFGINISLPMEQRPNPIVEGSPRHFYCQYFFTRKLFFLKESDAVILTPGGFGTLDETFETLTLLQTGRNPPMPVVLLEAPGEDYWGPFMRSWVRRLINDGLISPDDQHLMFHTDNIHAAVKHIYHFYENYHSFRYADDWVVLRLLNPLSDDSVERLNAEFDDVLYTGRIEQLYQWPESDDECYSHMPRLRFHLDRHRTNVLPQLIRRMNALYRHEHS
jgi:hypothetical protein